MRARTLTVLLVVAAVGATACGSSSKGAASGNTSTTTGTTTGNTPPASAGGSTTTIKVSGDSGSSFCNAIRGDVSAFKGTSFAGSSPTDLKNLYGNLNSALSEAESKAPSQIKGDFHTFVTAFTPLLQILKKANYDYTKISPSDYATFASLGTPQVKAASAHIEAYVTQVCHVSTTSPT